jgi:Domain of unknown function (DUF2017)
MPLGRRVRRTRNGDFVVRLPEVERQVLGALVASLRAALDGDVRAEPALRRLFPPAYADAEDGEAESQYQAMVHDELLASRRAALDVLEATAGRDRLDEAELLAWMTAVNQLRLVLGTRLDVREDADPAPDPEDPDAALAEVYAYLGVLLESIIAALHEG